MKNPDLVFEQIYDSSPEKVWKSLTNKELMKEWYFDIPDFVPVKGETFNFFEPGDEHKFHHRCEILDVVPFKKFEHTWTYPEKSKGKSVLKWELSPEGDKTRVVLTHSGVESFADGGLDFKTENFKAGWSEILEVSLKNFLNKI